MNLQNVAKIVIPDGEVKTIQNSNGDLLWGKVNYEVKYSGDSSQNGTPTPSAPVPVQTVTGENVVKISDGQGNEQSYEVNLGKNLYDKDSADYNVYLGSGSVAVNAQGNGWSIAIPVEVGQTYTFSRQFTTGQVSNTYYAFIVSTPAAGVAYIGGRQSLGTGTTFTATAPTGAKYLIIYYTWDATAAQKTDAKATFQIEIGSQATDFAAYFTPIELCKIGTYQDYIYKSGDKWYVRKEVGKAILDGSEAWETPNNRSYSLYKLNGKTSDMSLPRETLQMLCDYFTPTQLYDEVGSVGTGNSFINFNYDGTSSDLAGFKTWLTNNNVSLYAPLATPTDTEITNAALVGQLENVEQWLTRYGYNATVIGNLPIIIDRTAL